MIGADFLSGISMATFTASGIFFLRFWRASHDRFYLLFCFACWFLALERVMAQFFYGLQEPIRSAATEASSWVYLLRLAAFVVIMIAVVDKNRAGVGRR